MSGEKKLTTAAGAPVADNQNFMTAGSRGLSHDSTRLRRGHMQSKTKNSLLMAVAVIAIGTGTLPAWADGAPRPNNFWWPERLDLSPLRGHDVESNPYGHDFNYIKEFESLDLNAVKKDIKDVLTQSQDWWPADYGNYGPFFIRMAWHGAGTYRMYDGRGGADGAEQRFEPLNSWPDNVNLDRPGGCSGRSSRSMAGSFPGAT